MKISLVYKKWSCWIIVGSILLISAQNVFANEQQAKATVEAYLNALVVGDVEKIKSLATVVFSESLKHMDTNPASYSDFLKSRYKGVTMSVIEVARAGVSYKVRVSVIGSDDSEQQYYLLTVEDVGGVWLIANEE